MIISNLLINFSLVVIEFSLHSQKLSNLSSNIHELVLSNRALRRLLDHVFNGQNHVLGIQLPVQLRKLISHSGCFARRIFYICDSLDQACGSPRVFEDLVLVAQAVKL